MRPAELIARLVQPLNGSPGRSTVSTLWTTNGPPDLRPVSDGWPGRPSVSSSFPSGENFRTVWSPLSTVHTESSGPTVSPCGLVNSAPPQAVTNVPSGSYTSTLESYLVSSNTRSWESVPTADTSRWEIPAGSFSHCASTSYLKSAACGKSAACCAVVSPRIALSPSVSWRHGCGLRGPEPGQGAALPGVVEHDLDRQADGEIGIVGPDDVGHDPRALTLLAESQILDRLQHRDREGVIDRRVVDVADRHARLLECPRPGPHRAGVGQVDAAATRELRRLAVAQHRDGLPGQIPGHLRCDHDERAAAVADHAAIQPVQRVADHGRLQHLRNRHRVGKHRVRVVLRVPGCRHLDRRQLGA